MGKKKATKPPTAAELRKRLRTMDAELVRLMNERAAAAQALAGSENIELGGADISSSAPPKSIPMIFSP